MISFIMSSEGEKDCDSSDDEDLVNIFFLLHACNTLNHKKKKKETRRDVGGHDGFTSD